MPVSRSGGADSGELSHRTCELRFVHLVPHLSADRRDVDQADAVEKGAKVLTGGKRVPGRAGLWYEPTVVVDVDHFMATSSDLVDPLVLFPHPGMF